MKSSPKKIDLNTIVPQMAKAQKFFKFLAKLNLKSPYQYGNEHLRELRRWAERTYPHN